MKKNPALRQQDPFLAREQQRYDHPLPSREWVIELLEREGVPMKVDALAALLSISDDEMPFFERRLGAMARDGQVHINRRGAVCVAEKLAMVKCRIEAHKDGFGFAVPLTPTGEGDFVLYARQMRGLMHGDIVTVRPAGVDRRGRREGQVLDIIERAYTHVVGRLVMERGVAMLSPEDHRLTDSIILEPDSLQNAQPGQVIVAEIESYPEAHRAGVAKLTEVLGDYADSGMEIEIAVRKHHLPHIFSEGCLKQAAKIPASVHKNDFKGRTDLRDLPLVTIDGETARDFDDAVYAEKQGRNFRLVVAIADVSHYVHPGDGIDTDAIERATSVYFPRRVIPMLPENLSNGICSLNPDVERLCMVCDMVVTYAGNIKSFEFYPAVMRSHARLTYTEVWDWIANGSTNPLKPQIDTLYKLYQVLLKYSQQRRHSHGNIKQIPRVTGLCWHFKEKQVFAGALRQPEKQQRGNQRKVSAHRFLHNTFLDRAAPGEGKPHKNEIAHIACGQRHHVVFPQHTTGKGRAEQQENDNNGTDAMSVWFYHFTASSCQQTCNPGLPKKYLIRK